MLVHFISKGQVADSDPYRYNMNGFNNIDTAKYAILPFDAKYTWLFKKAQPTNLNEQDIQDIDELLNKCLAGYNPKQQIEFDSLSRTYPRYNFTIQNFIIDLARYKRQYLPVINEKGEKEVWVNCFCRTDNMDWKNNIVSVRDGGNCYFNLKINLSLKTYYGLVVNGEA